MQLEALYRVTIRGGEVTSKEPIRGWVTRISRVTHADLVMAAGSSLDTFQQVYPPGSFSRLCSLLAEVEHADASLETYSRSLARPAGLSRELKTKLKVAIRSSS
jgi:hypothetical protein